MSQRGLHQRGGAQFRNGGQDGLLHRAFLRGEGFTADQVRRTPVVGIANSASELNPCNAGLSALSRRVKEGVEAAGGLAIEFPTISISEPFTRPTSLYLRNLMSMDVEEMISTAPIDGVVLLGGCDKTVPAQVMGAVSADKPAMMVTAGPRPVSCFKGSATTIDDVWPLCESRRLGKVSDADWLELEGALNIGVGTCNVMGTASTMSAVVEVLGFALPGSAFAEAGSTERSDIAYRTGRLIVESIQRGTTASESITIESLENAFRVVCALGGSTNAVIHLEAIAGRKGLTIGTDLFEKWASTTPYLANIRPGGTMLLRDLDDAGGVPAILHTLDSLVHGETPTASGQSWTEQLAAGIYTPHPAITPLNAPLAPRGGLTMLTGNVAPSGAVLKTAGITDSALLQHRGRVVIFEGIEDLNSRIDDPDLDVDADSILVLRGMGVLGAPGMPEVGHIPIPAKLATAGVHDMVRLSDARMSGTSTGTVVLHISPEAAAGGPLGLLRNGDEVEIDASSGTISHHVPDRELRERRRFQPPATATRGFAWLHNAHALQADKGCDFDFLRADFVESAHSPHLGT
ncbi:dihydroxy-acid dehydratase [Rhodococcus sp. NPDC079359]|uniref:dihydroxy-acid dehydratase n=1 Tax=Rhodococcus sp. NPDC079359 TaxID=3154961 RepID=UPI00344DBA64